MKRNDLLAAAGAGLAAIAAGATASAQAYGYSDGEAEIAFGLPLGGDIPWFQSFDTNQHGLSVDRIVEIAAANGANGFGADPGSSGGVAVYQDPNDDSFPQDLSGSDLLAVASWTATAEGTDTLERVFLCPNATVSGHFWVAAWLSHGPGEQPAPIDTSTPSNGRSWVTGNVVSFDPYDPNAITNTPFGGVSGVFVLEANHDPMVIHVDADAMGANDGSSWSDAFVNLQDARCLAHGGDQVWVAAGTYRPDLGTGYTPGDRTESFELENGVAVHGGFLGFEPTLGDRDLSYVATLDGDLAQDDGPGFQNYGDNSCRVVRSPPSSTGSGSAAAIRI